MIRARARIDAEDRLLGFDAIGHAGLGERGYDIVCAAFTMLARTTFRALEALPGAKLEGSAADRGRVSFEVMMQAHSAERAAGIADFMVEGMRSLAQEYPEAVEFLIERERRE
jgi:uncharacterized protein YsxB (DUF464 family)